jgi:hypothetical protein
MRGHRWLVAALAAWGALGASARAQMPGQPVLQNAWTNPGLTVAGNFGASEGTRGYGVAASWGPASGRLALALGAGALDPKEGKTVGAAGARLSIPAPGLRRDRAVGLAVFAGVGGARPEGGSLLYVPAGIAGGWRRAIGETRGISVYVAPFYGWSRISADGVSQSDGVVRVSVGVDFAVTRSIGVSGGYETGQTAGEGNPGATGDVFGLGISYALGRR